jgi:hypothetical protein
MVDPTAPPDDLPNGLADGVFIADAYLVYITEIVAKTARILGPSQTYTRYRF